jgi:CMP-N-acetylneuraminic acid synthetase
MIEEDITAVIPVRKYLNATEKSVDFELLSFEKLILRKIRQLRVILPKDRVVVCTEDIELAELADDGGATVLMRPNYLAKEGETIASLIEFVAQSLNSTHLAWTPYVAPFFDTQDFKDSFNEYSKMVVSSDKFDSLVSVVRSNKFLWNSEHPINYDANKSQVRSDELPEMFAVCNGNYIAPRILMQKYQYYLGNKPFLDIKEQHCGIDIISLKALQDAKAYELIVRKTL